MSTTLSLCHERGKCKMALFTCCIRTRVPRRHSSYTSTEENEHRKEEPPSTMQDPGPQHGHWQHLPVTNPLYCRVHYDVRRFNSSPIMTLLLTYPQIQVTPFYGTGPITLLRRHAFECRLVDFSIDRVFYRYHLRSS